MNRIILHSIFISLIIGCALTARADTIDNFQVYLKGKIMLRESDIRPGAPYKFLVLTQSHINDTIFVNYSHCSPAVSGRKIVIWHGEDILFSRSYPDQKDGTLMAVPIKDVAGAYNMPDSNGSMVMFYYDKDLSADGVVLANILVDRSEIIPKPKYEKYVPQEPDGASTMEWVLAGVMIIFSGIMIFRKLTKPVQHAKRRR
jgi:hypothetical protein